MSTERDRSPIDQRWVQDYCDAIMASAQQLEPGVFRDALLRRVECAMDLVEAWQKRNLPMDQR